MFVSPSQNELKFKWTFAFQSWLRPQHRRISLSLNRWVSFPNTLLKNLCRNHSIVCKLLGDEFEFEFSHNIIYSCLASKIICIFVHQIKRQRLLVRFWPSVFRSPISSYPSTPPATLPSTALRYQTHLKRFWWRIFYQVHYWWAVGRYSIFDGLLSLFYKLCFRWSVPVSNFQYQISKTKRSTKGGVGGDPRGLSGFLISPYI